MYRRHGREATNVACVTSGLPGQHLPPEDGLCREIRSLNDMNLDEDELREFYGERVEMLRDQCVRVERCVDCLEAWKPLEL